MKKHIDSGIWLLAALIWFAQCLILPINSSWGAYSPGFACLAMALVYLRVEK